MNLTLLGRGGGGVEKLCQLLSPRELESSEPCCGARPRGLWEGGQGGAGGCSRLSWSTAVG